MFYLWREEVRKDTNYFFKTNLLRLFLEYTPIDIEPPFELYDQAELFLYALCNELNVEKFTRISSERENDSMQTPLRRFIKEHTASYFGNQKNF